eukprot:gene2979-4989_t
MTLTQKFTEHNSIEFKSNIYETKWIPSSSRFISVGCSEENNKQGQIQMYKINTSDNVLKLQTIKTDSPLKSCTFDSSLSNIRHLSVGDFSGKLSIFDLEKSKTIFSVQSHSNLINKIDGAGFNFGTTELCSASRDGDIKIWDTRQSKSAVFTYSNQIDCWSIAFGNTFSDTERMLAAGYKNGDLKVFDLRKNEIISEINIKNGISHLEFEKKESEFSNLKYGTTNGNIGILNLKEKPIEKEIAKSTIWSFSHVPQNTKYFITTDGSGQIAFCEYLTEQKEFKLLQKKFISNLEILMVYF